jgi:signal peptidase I
MFGFFASQEKKMRENARNWLELADKVWNFRRDRLSEGEASELLRSSGELRQQLKAKADAAKLKLSIENLEGVLRRTGGAIYPKTSLVENVEFFLVAAIVILGIRTYFVQPFKIPTNSMWPTYNGMTPEVFKTPADEPGLLAKVGRMVAFGAWPHRLNAPIDGEVLIPIGGRENRGYVHSRNVAGKSWLVFPATLREYTILVDNEPVTVRVPLDFDFDWAAYDAFFGKGDVYSTRTFITLLEEKLAANDFVVREVDGESLRCVRTGRRVKAGERLLAFDEMTGDQLFVDRFSYHFMRPTVGSGFVFRTGNIPYIAKRAGDQYYIKRLVGVPGDSLAIQGTTLLRNGAPITGSQAFAANAGKLGNYPGYQALGLLSPGATVQVEPHHFFAMGDNSANSEDGRYWGFVPEKDAIGRPLFIYFPFTRRWGPSR